MDAKQLKKYVKLRRLSSYSDNELIQEFSVYETALIDLSDIQYSESKETPNEMEIKVGKDLEILNHFIRSEETIMLPCPECKREQPFSVIGCNNPCVIQEENNDVPGLKAVRSGNMSRYRNVFQGYVPTYVTGSDRLCYISSKKQWDEQTEHERAIQKEKCIEACKSGLLNQIQEFRREFKCTFNNDHRLFVEFKIFDPISMIDAAELKRSIENNKDTELQMVSEQMKSCVVIEKTGQYPSIADLQMFDIEKYRKVLDKDSYQEFTRAIKLYANGIGCGSFVYLRRILEKLAERLHQQCKSVSGWNEEEYSRSRFDEKLSYLATYGEDIVPAPLSEFRAKIYGVLSKGVHESSDEECLELFPYMKFAIEEILDVQIRKKEQDKKIKDFKRTIQKQ